MNAQRPTLTLRRRRVPDGADSALTEKERIKRANASRLLEILREISPQVWDASTPLPLAIGIHRQIYPLLDRVPMSRRALRNFLAWWTGSEAYQRALRAPNACRHNVDGTVAGPV